MKNFKTLALATTLLTLAPGCALVRSTNATNVEDEAPTAETVPETTPKATNTPADTDPENVIDKPIALTIAPPPQRIQSEGKAGPNTKVAEAIKLYERALRQQDDGAFLEASKLWSQLIDRYPGMPGFEQSQYNLALSLFALGRPADAEEPLKNLISGEQNESNSQLLIDSRILLAECLVQTNHAEEALALSFELLPDKSSEEQAGIQRSKKAVGISQSTGEPSKAQKIRLLILRGRILGTLKKLVTAEAALTKAKLLLNSAGKSQLSQLDRTKLKGHLAWRRLEVLSSSCRENNPIPERLSEAEFLAYASSHYACAAPARQLFCEIINTKDEQIRSQALVVYRNLVEAPLSLKDHLPPPARQIRRREQLGPYESEMKALIEKTVQDHAKEFKTLDACDAENLF